MKKKIILCVCLLVLLFVLAGCATKFIDEYGQERVIKYGLVVIKSYNDDRMEICYDPATKVCYLKLWAEHRLALSPYYIIGENGKPEIAVYGVNFK